MTNDDRQISNDELKNAIDLIKIILDLERKSMEWFKVEILTLKIAERSLRLVGVVAPTPRRATSTIRQLSIFIRHSMKF